MCGQGGKRGEKEAKEEGRRAPTLATEGDEGEAGLTTASSFSLPSFLLFFLNIDMFS